MILLLHFEAIADIVGESRSCNSKEREPKDEAVYGDFEQAC
jgi:hypothetical protein